MTRWRALVLSFLAVSAIQVGLPMPASGASSFVGSFNTVTQVASTVPRNGDVNPYGVAVVPADTHRLEPDRILVSNFNNRQNLQGTGATIVQVAARRPLSKFAEIDAGRLPGQCPGGVGLTTALVSLKSGWVIVGSLPTKDGTSASMQAGCLLVLDGAGRVVETIFGDPINGPWDMTAVESSDGATLFVTNVLNGTVAASPNVVAGGTVVRIGLRIDGDQLPMVTSRTVIANGLAERTDPAALVVGPTGIGLATSGTLYVADSAANRLISIPDALTRTTPAMVTPVSTGGAINDPLGLAIAPNGDILTTNGGNGNLVETTPGGAQVTVKVLDATPQPSGANGNGTLFGLAVAPDGAGVYFVDDGSNTLNLLH
jgi:sugar lactone lactonase YvrE